MAGFGDHVRIRKTEDTDRLGLADREGIVFGWTTPSVTGVEVIGSPTEDFAINVHFDEPDDGFWFADDLVEFIDHGPGQVMSLDGIDLEWVRLPDGDWEQRPKSK